jgi:hypothetical protein
MRGYALVALMRAVIQGILLKFFRPGKNKAPSIAYDGLTGVANYYFGNIFLQESKMDDSVMVGCPVMGGAL